MYDIHIYHTDPVSEPSYAGGYFLHTTHDMPALRAKHRIYCGECDGDLLPQLNQALYPGCPNDIWAPTYNSGGPGDPGHLDTPYYYYFMTGDRTAYDGIMETAGWALRASVPNSRGREPGNFVFNLLYAYELTHQSAYRDKIKLENEVHFVAIVDLPVKSLDFISCIIQIALRVYIEFQLFLIPYCKIRVKARIKRHCFIAAIYTGLAYFQRIAVHDIMQ